MKRYCPDCDTETDTTMFSEVYRCEVCGNDWDDTSKPEVARLRAGFQRIVDEYTKPGHGKRAIEIAFDALYGKAAK